MNGADEARAKKRFRREGGVGRPDAGYAVSGSRFTPAKMSAAPSAGIASARHRAACDSPAPEQAAAGDRAEDRAQPPCRDDEPDAGHPDPRRVGEGDHRIDRAEAPNIRKPSRVAAAASVPGSGGIRPKRAMAAAIRRRRFPATRLNLSRVAR